MWRVCRPTVAMMPAVGMWESGAAHNIGQATLQRREADYEDIAFGAEPSFQDVGATQTWHPGSAGICSTHTHIRKLTTSDCNDLTSAEWQALLL